MSTTLQSALAHLLFVWDPEDLRPFGVPADEYEPESEDIAHVLRRDGRIDAKVFLQVWVHWFGGAAHLIETRNDPSYLAKLVREINVLYMEWQEGTQSTY